MQIQTDLNTGLTAEQVHERIRAGQVNTQVETRSKSESEIIKSNIFTFFNLINMVLAVLVIVVGSFKNLFFLVIVFANTIIGIIQELRAKRTLDKLSVLSATKVAVLRDAQPVKLDIEKLVLDDVMILAAGNQICADSVVTKGTLEVNESLLTGESDTVVKHVGDKLFSGSFVVSGKAYAQVEHVGADNYAQKLSSEAKAVKKHPSVLRDSMNRILKVISILIIPLGVGLFLQQYLLLNASFADAVIKMVAAVLGMIPEGLVLLTSIALAVGVIHLGRRKTLVQELFCIETLARVDVLCLDKTGTLTEGRMEVDHVELLNDAPVEEIMGNLLHALPDENATFLALKDHFSIFENLIVATAVPFSSARKYSGASFVGRGSYIMGAFEFILGGAYPDIARRVEQYAMNGIRVITLAHSEHPINGNDLPPDLKPCALICLTDVIRSDAKETLSYFAEQGVELMVISGDHPATVSHIAARVGLPGAQHYVDATTLQSGEAIEEAVQRYKVFGRVTPAQKKQIVQALKGAGHTVAMTGDGVNDVPALKEADCSIAMSEGSDAAKHCANLVLLDSNFNAMPYIVKEGRRVINNIQSAASLFLVKTIFSFVLTLIMLLLAQPYPFMPIQLSVISVFAVGVPTFILSLEPNFERVKAGFLQSVLINALTGALTIVLSVCFITAVTTWFGYSEDTRETMCMITTGIASLYMIRLVYPLQSMLRKLVYCSMFTFFLGGMLFMQGLLALSDLQYVPTMLLIILIIAAPGIIKAINVSLLWIQGAYRKRKSKREMKKAEKARRRAEKRQKVKSPE